MYKSGLLKTSNLVGNFEQNNTKLLKTLLTKNQIKIVLKLNDFRKSDNIDIAKLTSLMSNYKNS